MLMQRAKRVGRFWWGPRFCAAALSIFVVVFGDVAQAQMRQGTRRGFFEVSFGPRVGILNTEAIWARTALELGGHFERNSGGPALSGCVDFLGRTDWFGMEVGVKFRWDIQIRRGLAFYLTPTFRAGYALFSHNFDAPGHFFNLQAGFEARMIFFNRLILFFRPLSFEFNIFDHVEVAFDPGAGLGVSF